MISEHDGIIFTGPVKQSTSAQTLIADGQIYAGSERQRHSRMSTSKAVVPIM